MKSVLRRFTLENKRKFLVMNKGSPFFNYTFLESFNLQQALQNNKYGNDTPMIQQLLTRDFTENEILDVPFLKNAVTEFRDHKQQLQDRLRQDRTEELHLLTEELAFRNIIDIEFWRDIFHQVLWLKFKQFQTCPNLNDIMRDMLNFLQKFPSAMNTFKFNIHRSELGGVLPFKEAFISMYERKGNILDIQTEFNLFKLIVMVSSKTDINFRCFRNYYLRQVPRLPELLDGKDLQSVIQMKKIYNHFGILDQELTSMWDKKMLSLIEDKEEFDREELKGMIDNQFVKTVFLNNQTEIIRATKAVHLEATLIYSLTIYRMETQAWLDTLLQGIDLKKTNVIRTNSLHLCLHNLKIRGIDLKSHSQFVQQASSRCLGSHPEVIRIINKKGYPQSPCLLPSHNNYKKNTILQNPVERWFAKLVIQNLQDQYLILVGVSVCIYEVDIMLIDNQDNIYALEIAGSHYTDQKGNYKHKRTLKMELLEHYGIKIIPIQTTNKQKFNWYKRKSDYQAITYIKKQLAKLRDC